MVIYGFGMAKKSPRGAVFGEREETKRLFGLSEWSKVVDPTRLETLISPFLDALELLQEEELDGLPQNSSFLFLPT